MKQFKKGDKVKYLGHPAIITNVEDRMGKTYYSVSYNKGTGKTKASMILSTDGSITELNEKSKGLWYYINKKKKSGKRSAPKGSKAYKAAVKAGNKLKRGKANENVVFRSNKLRIEIVEHNEPVLFTEAEYQGRKVKLNKIMQGDVKKFKVYVNTGKKNKDGTIKVKKVNFGQGGGAKGGTMRIRKSNPKARASFRARHNCDNPGPKTKARYWSCRKW